MKDNPSQISQGQNQPSPEIPRISIKRHNKSSLPPSTKSSKLPDPQLFSNPDHPPNSDLTPIFNSNPASSPNQNQSPNNLENNPQNNSININDPNNTPVNPNDQNQPPTQQDILNQIKQGHFALKCWNCHNIHIIGSDVTLFQCPICKEVNKIPRRLTKQEELLNYLKANTLISYADKEHLVPLVNYLVVCPYCKTDNKVRESAYHCICYRCKNRWSLRKPDENKEEIDPLKMEKNEKLNYYKYDANTGLVYPPDRGLRFSDLLYPDPLFYPGFYPVNSLSPLYPEYFSPYDDIRYRDRMNKMGRYEYIKGLYNENIKGNKANKGILDKYDVDKVDLMYKLGDISRKVDRMMEDRKIKDCLKNSYSNSSLNRYDESRYENKYSKTYDSYDRLKPIENSFFMKK